MPEREADLLKKIKSLEQQIEQQKMEHEKNITQRCQQELKKIKVRDLEGCHINNQVIELIKRNFVPSLIVS